MCLLGEMAAEPTDRAVGAATAHRVGTTRGRGLYAAGSLDCPHWPVARPSALADHRPTIHDRSRVPLQVVVNALAYAHGPSELT